jgi:FkbM family methyltransferase
MISRIAQTIENQISGPSKSWRRLVVRAARRVLLLFVDPEVQYAFEGRRLTLPLSHPLPIYRAKHPMYDANLAPIAAALLARDPEMTVIDVGANVGDSATALALVGEFPIVCVEGEPAYLRFLRLNTRSMPWVSIAPTFIGDGELLGNIRVHRGTARIQRSSFGSSLPSSTLESLEQGHPPASKTRLVKIDTDGMDFSIIEQNLPWLSSHRSAIYFEYDPGLAGMREGDLERFWEHVRNAGYAAALLFRNTGEFATAISIDKSTSPRLACEPFLGRASKRYLDICIFPAALVETSNHLATSFARREGMSMDVS